MSASLVAAKEMHDIESFITTLQGIIDQKGRDAVIFKMVKMGATFLNKSGECKTRETTFMGMNYVWDVFANNAKQQKEQEQEHKERLEALSSLDDETRERETMLLEVCATGFDRAEFISRTMNGKIVIANDLLVPILRESLREPTPTTMSTWAIVTFIKASSAPHDSTDMEASVSYNSSAG